MPMRYTQDEFFRLIDAIEDQGGTHLDKTHDPRYHAGLTGPHRKGVEVVYCNEDAIFEVPYDDGTPQGAVIEICAVCDGAGRWPRFASARARGVMT